jgi:large subunit ribosomal protein L14e
MPYKQFVEVGRLALISFGPLADSIAVVVDIIDATRVLIDVPNSSEPRQAISVKRLKLTDIVVNFPRAAAPDVVAQAVADEDALGKWSATNWAKRLSLAKAKGDLTDFQRFKYAKIVDKRRGLVKAALAKASGGKGQAGKGQPAKGQPAKGQPKGKGNQN